MTAGRRVPGAPGVAGATGPLVERQEAGLCSFQPGGHRHLVGIDREVHNSATGERDVGGVSVLAILLLSLLDTLSGQWVLELCCGSRDAVDQQGQVDRVVRVRVVGELSSNRDPIGRVELLELRGEAVRRAEECKAQLYPVVVDAVAQDVHSPPDIELGGEALGEPTTRRFLIAAVAALN